MLSISHRPVALAALAIILALNTPACAQNRNAQNPVNTENSNGGWENETFEHQEFREEMAQIRKEHEDLEAARDKLMDKCVNVSREQAEECNKERQALRDRQAQLHERTHALHEKMKAAHHEAQPAAPTPAGAPPR